MQKKNNTTKFASVLLGALYMFVVLFSQNFHHHGSGQVFKDFHFVKSEKSISKASYGNDGTDCSACHLFNEGNAVLKTETSFKILETSAFQKVDAEIQSVYLYKQREAFSLRGPPMA